MQVLFLVNVFFLQFCNVYIDYIEYINIVYIYICICTSRKEHMYIYIYTYISVLYLVYIVCIAQVNTDIKPTMIQAIITIPLNFTQAGLHGSL